MNIYNILKTIDPSILAAVGDTPPVMLKIIFWVFLAIWAAGGFFLRDNPKWSGTGSSILLIILFAILGLYTFGF